jgi:hypothetical protein
MTERERGLNDKERERKRVENEGGMKDGEREK